MEWFNKAYPDCRLRIDPDNADTMKVIVQSCAGMGPDIVGRVYEGAIQIPVLSDMGEEGDETFSLYLENAVGASIATPSTTVITIENDDDGGEVCFALINYFVGSVAQELDLMLERSGENDGAVSVSYSTVAGTASAGSDYAHSSGTVSFANGQKPASLTVHILNASLTAPETFSVVLSNPQGGLSLGTADSVCVHIVPPGVLLYETMDVDPQWSCEGVWLLVSHGSRRGARSPGPDSGTYRIEHPRVQSEW